MLDGYDYTFQKRHDLEQRCQKHPDETYRLVAWDRWAEQSEAEWARIAETAGLTELERQEAAAEDVWHEARARRLKRWAISADGRAAAARPRRRSPARDEGAQCEDEGFDSDREPDDHHIVPSWRSIHNQREAWPAYKGVDGP